MTPEIWQDLKTRMENVRGDMVGQWQGELSNRDIENGVMALGNAILSWEQAKPVAPPPPPPVP